MKVHKIRNVAIDTCCAEQKIAYNICFAHCDCFRSSYNACDTEFQRFSVLMEISDRLLGLYKSGYDYKEGRYNEDAIFVALNTGLRKYLDSPFIASSYEQIGQVFDIPYSKERR